MNERQYLVKCGDGENAKRITAIVTKTQKKKLRYYLTWESTRHAEVVEYRFSSEPTESDIEHVLTLIDKLPCKVIA